MRALVALLSLFLMGATYYVDNSSVTSADCDVYETPCRPNEVWASVSAGDTVIYKDGEYAGANYMVDPGKSGSVGLPITISCENDGACFLDGEDTNVPVDFYNLAYIDIDGFDAAHSISAVFTGYGGDHFNWRRMVAWDGGDNSEEPFIPGSDTLVEDCASFGVGRKMFSLSGQDNITFRRVWGRYEGNQYEGPRMAGEMFYYTEGTRIENAIFTWTAESMFDGWDYACKTGNDYPDDYYRCENFNGNYSDWTAGNPRGPFGVGKRYNPGDDVDAEAYGMIVYMESNGLDFPTYDHGRGLIDMNIGSGAHGCGQTYDNVAIYVDPAIDTEISGNVYGIMLVDYTECSGDPNFMSNVSSVADSGDHDSTNDDADITDLDYWTFTDYDQSDTVANLDATIYEGSGAVICKRYEDGSLTDVPLWPWPMQGRIYAATTRANAAGHEHMMLDCSGASVLPSTATPCTTRMIEHQHTVADVTGDIVRIFGGPPPECKKGGSAVVN